MGEWQPIETALKDGKTWVLVRAATDEPDSPFGPVWVAQVNEERFQSVPGKVGVVGFGKDGERYGWFPTHWKPLG